MSNESTKQPQYWTTGICIMLLSWVVFSTQTFEPTAATSADPTVTANEVSTQSPGNSHFRGGHINWRLIGNPSDRLVEFDITNAFRCTSYSGSPACPGSLMVGGVITESVGPTTFDFGDGTFFGTGTNTGLLQYKILEINVADNWFFARAINASAPDEKIRHKYGGPGPFTAEINGAQRNFVEINNILKGYRISTIINLSMSTQTQSPVSTLEPIISCPVGLCMFTIPVSEGDGDFLNFRLSTSSEACDPSICDVVPPFDPDPFRRPFLQPGEEDPVDMTQPGCVLVLCDVIDVSSTGTVTWDTTGFTVGLYSTSITIEEIRNGSVIGKVMVDFLIDIAVPSFVVPPTPPNGFTFNIIVGVILPFQVQCSDPNVGDSVTIGNLGLPLDATFTPAVPTGNPATGVFTFAPIAVQTVSVTFTCTDTNGNSAPPHTININVTPAPPLVVKTVHAEKESFNVIEDGIPFIKDVTIIAEIHEDLNNQLVIRKQVLVVTCLKIPDTGTVVKCSVSVPSTFFFPVSNCSETTVGSQSMNTIVQKKSSISESDAMNTVAKGFLVKTVHVNKEAFICDFDNADPTDDVKVDLLTFTEIFENLNRLNLDPPQDPIIKTTFETFRCVMSLETHIVEACDFPFIF